MGFEDGQELGGVQVTLDHRIIDEWSREWIVMRHCGCAFILRTGEQVSFCGHHPPMFQLKLPYED